MWEKLYILKKVNRVLVLTIAVLIAVLILGYRFYGLKYGLTFGISTPDGRSSNLLPAWLSGGRFVAGGGTQDIQVSALPGAVSPADSRVAVSSVKIALSRGSFYGKKLRSFEYSGGGGQAVTVSGFCSDAYYVVLIFDAKNDFSKNPNTAKYNRASKCPSAKSFSETIDLGSLNLPAGTYYFFAADQGVSGSWYNPR